MASNQVQEGDHVVFKRNNSSRVFKIRRNRPVYFEKTKFSVEELLDQPYGCNFEIDRGKLIKLEPSKVDQAQIDAKSTPDQLADNRNLLDSDLNQKMSKDDIDKMKEDGATGEEIIEELIGNSETFKNKTEFSQAKYLNKKKKKHILSFTILKPTPRLVMEIFAKEPQKICYLRQDSLSQLLSYSNIMCGSNVAVVETCQGLVLSCVLQRLGGHGKLIQLIPNGNSQVCRQIVDYFSFSQDELLNMYSFPLDALTNLASMPTTDEQTPDAIVSGSDVKIETSSEEKTAHAVVSGSDVKIETLSEEKTGRDVKIETSSDGEVEGCAAKSVAENEPVVMTNDGSTKMETSNGAADNVGEGHLVGEKRPFVSNREQQRLVRESRQKEAGNFIKGRKLDSLIIACKYNPTPIVKHMLPFLPPSRHVVVFCQFIEPLVEIYTYVKEKHLGLQVKLSESWFREYQILPQRSHPMINMSGTGGYLLTFMTCDASPATPQH